MIVINVMFEVIEIVLFVGEWYVIFLFVGEDNLVIMVVW